MRFEPYWDHLQQAWYQRSHPNIHIMFYEEMKPDLLGELRCLRDFLQMDLSEDQLSSVVEHTNLKKMRERKKKYQIFPYFMKGSFFHGGSVGRWADNATLDLDIQMNQWIKEKSRHVDNAFMYK